MPGKKLQGKRKKKWVERGGSKEMNWHGSRVLVQFFLTTSFNSTRETNDD